ETSQRVHAGIGSRERNRSTPRPTNRKSHDFNGDQRKYATHRKPVTFARERAFLVQVDAQRRQALHLHRLSERQYRFRRDGLQPCKRFAGLVAKGIGDILGKAHDPSIRELRRKAKSMRRRRRYQNYGGRREGGRTGLVIHLTSALLNQQNLEK